MSGIYSRLFLIKSLCCKRLRTSHTEAACRGALCSKGIRSHKTNQRFLRTHSLGHSRVRQRVQECCFLPQKPYMPLGSLRQQLLFPVSDNDRTAVSAAGFPDTSLRRLAERVCLPRAPPFRSLGDRSAPFVVMMVISLPCASAAVVKTISTRSHCAPRLEHHFSREPSLRHLGAGAHSMCFVFLGVNNTGPLRARPAPPRRGSVAGREIRRLWCAEIADPETDLSAVDNWAEIFSVGEQQRIAFLRLLRSRPALAILDEATSAMDIATEHTLYQQLRLECSSFVSVGHRPQLAQYHTHVLTWQAPGVWELTKSEAQMSAAAPTSSAA